VLLRQVNCLPNSLFAMTDTYLRSLGFAPTDDERRANQLTFDRAWRYRHSHQAHDGAALYIEHPLGVDCCRLSTQPAPLDQRDVEASVPLRDGPALEAAVAAFFAAHGGQGPLVPVLVPFNFGPARRQL
jgi:hypothetical protein